MEIRNTTPSSERGQSLVEFAIVLPILLLLLAGTFDAARAFFTYMAMREAAQESAAYASVNPSDTVGITFRARDATNLLQGLGTNMAVTVTPTVSGKFCAGVTGTATHGIRVRLNYPNFPLTMPFIGQVIGRQTVSISTEAIDTILIPKCP